MESHSLTLLTDIGLGIIFATVCAHAAQRLKQPLILGYVLGGVLLGSHLGFGLISDQESIELISEIGLILLLFIIGLEINLRELVGMGKAMFILGFVQFAVCVAIGMGCFRLFGYGMGGGRFDLLYIGVALALSSTLIVVKLLHDKFEINTVAGRLTLGVLILQDVWAIIFMAFQPNLLDPRFASIAKSLGLGTVLILAAFTASRYLLSRLFRAAAKSPELVLLTSMAWCFSVCGLAEEAGLSKEMGALIAGMSIAAFPYGADVIAKLSGVRDFFVTLFFVSLGLKVPRPTWALVQAAAAALSVVLAGRLVSIVPTVFLLGKGMRNGFVTALNLSQISEFSLVILALGASYRHVSGDLPGIILASMLAASVFSTYLIQFNDPLARWMTRGIGLLGLKESQERGAQDGKLKGQERDVVILGCFRAALALLEEIERHDPELKHRILIVDFNPALGETLADQGYRWVYGDIAHPETLKHLGIGGASVVLCSISDTYLKGITNRRLVGHLKRLCPDAVLVMTAEESAEADKLLKAGARHVLVPSLLEGRRLFDLVRGTKPEPV